MTRELHHQDQEEEHEENVNRGISRDAAILVVEHGYSRDSAIANAKDISENQRESIGDITGTIETLEEAQSPSMPENKAKQVHVVEKELFNKYFGL